MPLLWATPKPPAVTLSPPTVMGGTPTEPHITPREEATARPSNQSVVSARYHKEGGRSLPDDYDVHGTFLGEGMSGTVVLATGRLDGRSYAVKRFRKKRLSARQVKDMQREVQIYLSIDHPGVAQLCDVYDTSEQTVLVMECCAGGELFDRVLEQGRYSEPDAAAAVRQMLCVTGYLHAHKIVHRDLKLENWVYQSTAADAPLKLIDFGLAKVWGHGMPNMHQRLGSLAYISPDVFSEQGYTGKCDLWSMGVIAFILLSGYMPFTGDDSAMQLDIQAGSIDWHSNRSWRSASEPALAFVRALLTVDPVRRPDANAALAHPWLARLDAPEVPRLSRPVVVSMREYAGSSRLRRAALQLLARELLPEESQELSQLFLGLDQSNSGTISVFELADALGELSEEGADADLRPRASSRCTPKTGWQRSPSTVSTVDSDYHAWSCCSSPVCADLDEWSPRGSSGSTTPLGAGLAEAAELFRVLDANGDGEVYCSDFIAAALDSLPRLREQAVQRVFARLDADRSGSISAEDLCLALGGPCEDADLGALLASSGAPLDARGEAGPCAFAALLWA